MYHTLFGINPQAAMLFALLDLHPQDVGRFRDITISEEEGSFFINIFTRNGGGNREDQAPGIQTMLSHPMYVRDYDDDFDSTYATFVFKVAPKDESVVKALMDKNPTANTPPMEKFKAFLKRLESNDISDPEVAKAIELGRSILKPVLEQIAEGGGPVAVLDSDFKRSK